MSAPTSIRATLRHLPFRAFLSGGTSASGTLADLEIVQRSAM